MSVDTTDPRARRLARSGPVWSMVCAVALLSCGKTESSGPEADAATGGVSEAGAGNEDAGGNAGHSSGARPSGGTGGRSGGAGPGGAVGEGGSHDGGEPGCLPEAPADAPLRWLNRFEYENSLRELFGEQSWAADTLPLDPYEEPTAPPSPALVEAQQELSRDLAFRVTRSNSATYDFIGCDAVGEGEEECRDRFVAEFVERVFRRPLAEREIEQFTSAFDDAAADGGFPLGVRAVVQVALESPEFLSLPEFGVEAPERGDGWARPAPYEMASRLAYFLWGAPPDAELLEAARTDTLSSPDELEAQARRMLADPRAFEAVGHFYLRLLELERPAFPAVGLSQYPSFTPEIAAELLGETKAFVADATLVSDGDLRTLLTAPHTFVNEPLAAFYGLDGVTGSEFRKVDVDASRRGGLLTQASFLSATAKGPFTNPSRRGVRVAAAFLCQDMPAPPTESPVPGPLPPNTTTRERYAEQISSTACAVCHSLFDPLGFAFEHYDAAGLYRDTENGVTIDATGTLLTSDAAGDFDGALELAERLAGSDDVRRCFVQKWFGFALGRAVTAADACYLSELEREFVQAEMNLQDLLIALLRSDAFLYRPAVAP